MGLQLRHVEVRSRVALHEGEHVVEEVHPEVEQGTRERPGRFSPRILVVAMVLMGDRDVVAFVVVDTTELLLSRVDLLAVSVAVNVAALGDAFSIVILVVSSNVVLRSGKSNLSLRDLLM